MHQVRFRRLKSKMGNFKLILSERNNIFRTNGFRNGWSQHNGVGSSPAKEAQSGMFYLWVVINESNHWLESDLIPQNETFTVDRVASIMVRRSREHFKHRLSSQFENQQDRNEQILRWHGKRSRYYHILLEFIVLYKPSGYSEISSFSIKRDDTESEQSIISRSQIVDENGDGLVTIADGNEGASHIPTELASSGSMDLIENEFQFLKDYDSSGMYMGSPIRIQWSLNHRLSHSS